MQDIDKFLSRLDKVKKTGTDRWIASCPSHDDKNPSLNIKQGDDGRILVICRAGCNNHEIMSSINLKWRDLYPSGSVDRHMPKNSFPASDVLRAIQDEALLFAIIACDLKAYRRGEKPLPSDEEFDRVIKAAGRIKAAYE